MVDKTGIKNSRSESKIIRIALSTPKLGSGIDSINSLKKSGELASLLSSKVVSKIGPRLEKDDILSNKIFFK